MTLACRLLIDPAPNGGAWNMAADDMLLEAGVPALRFYRWAEPTLSLGYFQPHLAARAVPELAWLRRATGGEAIVHHHELTYSLALPRGRISAPLRPWMRRFHGLIGEALKSFRVDALPCERELRLGETLCFLHHTPGDLVVAGHKVVGSAQRVERGTLFQHGSILLRQSVHTPALPGIAELTGQIVPTEELREALIDAFRRETDWTLESGELDADRGRIEERIASRYASPAWNEKR